MSTSHWDRNVSSSFLLQTQLHNRIVQFTTIANVLRTRPPPHIPLFCIRAPALRVRKTANNSSPKSTTEFPAWCQRLCQPSQLTELCDTTSSKTNEFKSTNKTDETEKIHNLIWVKSMWTRRRLIEISGTTFELNQYKGERTNWEHWWHHHTAWQAVTHLLSGRKLCQWFYPPERAKGLKGASIHLQDGKSTFKPTLPTAQSTE